MRYLCCACNKRFPSTEAIDGFAQGYRRGFLCPHCQTNLDGHFDVGAWLKGEGQPLSAILVACLLAMFASFKSHLAVPLPGFSAPIWTLFAATAVGIGIVLAIRIPDVLFNPLMHTKRIAGGKQTP